MGIIFAFGTDRTMFKIAIVVCLLSAVCALPAPEADAVAYYTPYQGYQEYNVQPAFNNQRGYNQLAYNQEDAKTSLEQEQMGDQMKAMLRSLYSTFIDLKLEDTAKQSVQSAMAAYNQGRYKRSAQYQGYSNQDAKTSLEQEKMAEQMKDMLRSLFSTFIDLKLENTAKQSAQSAMA